MLPVRNGKLKQSEVTQFYTIQINIIFHLGNRKLASFREKNNELASALGKTQNISMHKQITNPNNNH